MLRPLFVSPRRREGPPNIWDTPGISGNVFANPHASSSAPYPQELNSPWKKTIEEPLHMSTAEKSDRPERNQDLRCQSGPSAKRFSHLQWRRLFKELWGRPTTTADFGSPFWQVPYASNLCLLEDKVQDRGMYLFTIPYGSDAIDQRSGVGWFSGWIDIFVIYSWYFNAEFWSTWCEDCFGTDYNHPEFPVQKENQSGRNKRPRKRTVSFAVDRSLTWSTSTSRSLEPTILSRIIPTYLLLVFEMTIFRNSILCGDGILLSMTKIPHDDITWRLRRSQDLMITYWKLWWREVLSRKFEYKNFGERRGQESGDQNSVDNEFLETVGNGKPTGSVWKETIAVSATISISVEKVHHQIPSPNSLMRQEWAKTIEDPKSQR